MADDKKKPAPSKDLHPIEVMLGLFVLASVVGAILNNLTNYVEGNGITFYGIRLSIFSSFFSNNAWLFTAISFTFSIFAAVTIVALSQMRGKILIEQKKKLFPSGEPEVGAPSLPEENPLKDKWKEILSDVESTDESKWRVAIIEADIILEDLLRKLNLPGDTIGDKLKAVEKSDFVSINSAWEAHKVRNNIAHGGSGFLFNQREARRAIMLYEQVFKEFFLI